MRGRTVRRAFFVSVLFLFVPHATHASGQDAPARAGALIQSPAACGGAQAVRAPEPTPEARREMEAKLSEARAHFERNPRDADAAIWLGRRTAYLGRFDEAIRIYTEAIRRHPRDARLYRHRGHRLITLRCLDAAVADLSYASRLIKGRRDETEPDGQPNERNIPIGTLHSNVWYHLALAHYLRGDFRAALRAGREGLKVSDNPDRLVSQTYWVYMTLRRLNRHAEAQKLLARIRPDMEIIENRDYHRLLLMYKGATTPEALLAEASKNENSVGFATVAYGVGNHYLYTGRLEQAFHLFRRIIDGSQTTSFGHIAAEAELGRGFKDFPRVKLPVKVIE